MKVLKIVAGVILIFVGICTWSDYYYSKLRRDYPLVLSDTVAIDGVITHYEVHWKYSYITIDDTMKIVVRPTVNDNYETKYLTI